MDFWEWFNEHKPRMRNRAENWVKIFEHLDGFKRPVQIIETGCVRQPDDFEGAGHSTLIFDQYVQDRGGTVYSVDIDPVHTALCRALVSDRVKVHTGDSVAYLAQLASEKELSPDLIYLDSLDWMETDPFQTALHCADEFQAVRPLIRDDTLVVVDDTPGTLIKGVIPQLDIQGKGAFLVKYAETAGAELMFHDWQAGWTHMATTSVDFTKKSPLVDMEIDRLIVRARAHVEGNRGYEAAKLYRVVIGRTAPPKSAVERIARGEACVFFARLAASVCAYGTAIDWYRDGIDADPRAVDYRLELALRGYRPMNNWQLGRQEALRATLLEPDNQHAWRVLGDMEMTLCDVKGATKAYDRQLELAPDDPNAMLDRCVISLDTSDFKLTKELAEKVLKTDRRSDGLHVLAMIANRQGRHEDAVVLYDQAIEAGCNNIHTAHWNKSLSLHAIGRLREGWVEHEHRRHEKNNNALSIAFQRFALPCWDGEPPPAIVHVHAEAGMGDNICLSRYLRPLVERGYEVRYETHAELIGLMRRSFPDVTVVERPPDYPGTIGLIPFDYHLPVGSMPYVFETDLGTIPWDGPYLKPDPELVKHYKKRLRSTTQRRVGLCWSSGIRDYGVWLTEYGKRKSTHFDDLAPILEMPESFVSLQIGPEREQMKTAGVQDLLPEQPSWDDTAALIANLDLVITVDTAIAHLAGAMGKPVWVMAQRDASTWHFMCWRPGASWNERSPWYPSVRVFRQHEFNRPHYWDDVVNDVAKELSNIAERKIANG